MKELEHAAESLSANYLTHRLADVNDGIDKFIIMPLVIELGVKMFETGS